MVVDEQMRVTNAVLLRDFLDEERDHQRDIDKDHPDPGVLSGPTSLVRASKHCGTELSAITAEIICLLLAIANSWARSLS